MFSQMCACRIGVERKVFKNDWLLLVLYITVTSVVRESCIHCCRSLDIVSVYFRSPEEKSSCWPDEIKLYTTILYYVLSVLLRVKPASDL